MNQQRLLFDDGRLSVEIKPAPVKPVPIRGMARNTDPAPSHAAAAEITSNGSAAALCTQIVTLLGNTDHRAPALTPGEIAKKLNEANGSTFLDSVKVLKRLADLRTDGVADSFGERKCTVNNRSVGVWVLVDPCCGHRDNHAFARFPDTDFETIQCVKCSKALGVRRVEK